MNKPYIVAVALAFVLLVAAAGVAGAGSSASYAINWQVLGGGGAPAFRSAALYPVARERDPPHETTC